MQKNPSIRPALLSIVAICITMVIASGCRTSQFASPSENVFRSTFEPCQLPAPIFGGTITADCGTLSVPENRASPGGREIDLHVATLPAISRNPLRDPLFFITGGPGQAATESYGQVAAAFMPVNQNRDIVLVDQRGTGQSNALRCPITPELQAASEPSDAQIEAWLTGCLDDLAADPAHYTTVDAVEDLEHLRLTLGYERINLYGVSYGTRVALAYADRYPGSTRSIILDGVVPGDQIVGLHVARNAQESLDRIMRLCESDEHCSQSFPDLAVSFKQLLERVVGQPVDLSLPHPTTGVQTDVVLDHQAVAMVTRLHSYAPETVAILPLLIHTAQVEGNLLPLAAQSLLVGQQLEDSISIGMNLSIVCSEDAPFLDDETINAANNGSYYEHIETDRIRRFCSFWPAAPVDPNLKQPVHSDVPALLLSGDLDPVTPPSNGRRAAETLSNSVHVIAPFQGHSVAIRGCIPSLIESFIDTAAPGELDVTCIEVMKPVPFFLSFSGPSP